MINDKTLYAVEAQRGAALGVALLIQSALADRHTDVIRLDAGHNYADQIYIRRHRRPRRRRSRKFELTLINTNSLLALTAGLLNLFHEYFTILSF